MVTSPTRTTVEGFSLSHAAILDGVNGAETTQPELVNLYGIRDGALQTNTGQYDNTGDEAVLSSWFWFNHVQVTVKSGYIPFDTIALLTGATVTSSGSAPTDYYSLPLWETQSTNQPARPMLVRIPSKDAAGAVRQLDIVLYKVQFMPMKFEGPTYKTGLLCDYTGLALTSLLDEAGNVLAHKAIGRLVSRPAVTS